MSSIKTAKFGPAILLASLLVNAVFVSCGADAVTSPTVVQAADPALLAELTRLTQRLDSIESKMEQRAKADSAALDARFAGLQSTLMSAGIGDPGIGFDSINSQLDYLQTLTNWMVTDMSSPGWEHCGEVQAQGGFDIKLATETKGRAEGFFGIDGYGNGGKAKAKFDTGVEADLGLGIAGSYALSRCVPINAGAPTIEQPGSPSIARAAGADAFVASMGQLASQLGMSETSALQAVEGLGQIAQSAASFDVGGLAQTLPLPGGLSAIASDPVGSVATQISDGLNQAQGALCSNTGNWGANLSTVLAEACDRIDNPPDFSLFFSTIEELPTRVDNVTSRLTAVCGAVGSMIPMGRFSIASRSITVPPFSILGWNPQTYTTFPGFTGNLFAGLTVPNCT